MFTPTSRPGPEDGFSLIEVLVTALMVVLIGSGAVTALIASGDFSGDQRYRSQADALAQQDQSRLMGLSNQQLNGLHQTRQVSFPNGASFTITSTTAFEDTSGKPSCTSGGSAYYKITSTVTWPSAFSQGPHQITEESIMARPYGNSLVVSVTDQTGAPLPGITVSTTTPTAASGVTDTAGCAVLDGLTAGNYNATLTGNSSGRNYVDQTGNASPTLPAPPQTASVPASGAGTAGPATMGLAGRVNGAFTTAINGTGGEADSISWQGVGAVAATTATSTPVLSSPVSTLSTPATLFPFDQAMPLATPSYMNNYTVWAGVCPQMEPPTGVDQFEVDPGSTVAASVQEPLLDLQTVTYNGTAVKPTAVKITFTGLAGPPPTNMPAACNDTWYPTINPTATTSTEPTTGWLQNPGQPFASDQTSGSLASPSKATGTLEVCAQYSGYWGNVSKQTNTNFTATPVALPTIAITSSTKC